ncbi:MAG: EscU/YscU/HrcU family type III secretion system export apparatus switch protein, partial [Phycisphaerales bacterium]
MRAAATSTAASLGGATVRAAWGLAMAGAVAATVWMHWPAIAALPALGLGAGLARAAPVVTDALRAAVGAGLAVAAVDVAAARMRWRAAARMDTAVAREARRLEDGQPEVRAQRRAAARHRRRAAATSTAATAMPAPTAASSAAVPTGAARARPASRPSAGSAAIAGQCIHTTAAAAPADADRGVARWRDGACGVGPRDGG